MTGLVLRASGSTKAVRAFLATTDWKPCITYFRGQPKFPTSKRKSTVCGFNLNISNASGLALPVQVRSAVRFLRKEHRELQRLHSLGLHAGLDFGVTSNAEVISPSYRFPTNFIASLAVASLGLEVSYYGVER